MYCEKLSVRLNMYSPQSMNSLYIFYRLDWEGGVILIAGIGLDIVELDRIANLDARSSKFRMRILTAEELKIYESLHD